MAFLRRRARRRLARIIVLFLFVCTSTVFAMTTVIYGRQLPAEPGQQASAATPPPATPSAQPSPTPTPEPTPMPTPTPTPTATPTPEPSPTPEPTPSPEPSVPLDDPRWAEAIHTRDGGVVGVVTATSLNIRSAPHLDATIVDKTYARHPVIIYEAVAGDPVDGDPTWYRVGAGRYVAAALVAPLVVPPPPQTFPGHWLDVNLSTFYAIAYDGATPVYAALITAGRDGKTPTGVFQILRRVRTETMDAATVGIPKGHPDYYYLEDVQFTQYFAEGGYALHQNYWTPPWAFGGFGSNGCVGLLLPDAAFLWEFLAVGATVAIHY
ncbi:MAG: L,D-transpeptidase family protein [Sphaerobacter sp.]|nr:L,D-transpeptidase family protein [Sphaerobacter sp.]